MPTEENNSAKLSPPFSRVPKPGVSNRGHTVHGKNTKLTAIYYNPETPTAFSTLHKLAAAIPWKNKSDFKAWLLYQDNYTMHRTARRRFLRNPYTVSKLKDVWESDILDMQSLSKYIDTYRYILFVIYVFSKYLHLLSIEKGRAALQSPRRFDPYYMMIHAAPYGYVLTRSKNF